MWQYPEWHILAGCKKYLNICYNTKKLFWQAYVINPVIVHLGAKVTFKFFVIISGESISNTSKKLVMVFF